MLNQFEVRQLGGLLDFTTQSPHPLPLAHRRRQARQRSPPGRVDASTGFQCLGVDPSDMACHALEHAQGIYR